MNAAKKQTMDKLAVQISKLTEKVEDNRPKDQQVAVKIHDETTGNWKIRWVTVAANGHITLTDSRRNAKLYNPSEAVSVQRRIKDMLNPAFGVSLEAQMLRERVCENIGGKPESVITCKMKIVQKDDEVVDE